jgi:hypothetical protein
VKIGWQRVNGIRCFLCVGLVILLCVESWDTD